MNKVRSHHSKPAASFPQKEEIIWNVKSTSSTSTLNAKSSLLYTIVWSSELSFKDFYMNITAPVAACINSL